MTNLFSIEDNLYELRGAKVAAFLHGQLTNDIKNLKSGETCYNFLLNTKGRIQGDLFVYHVEARWFLSVAQASEKTVLEHLQKLAFLSQVEIIALPQWILLHSVADVAPTFAHNLFCVANPRFFTPGFDVAMDRAHLGLFTELATEEERLAFRLKQGVPQFGVDFDSRHLPQETALWHALHFDKGCYLGQEIVARLQFRGHVNKRLVRFVSDAASFAVDCPLLSQAKPVGQITSLIFDAKTKKTFGLAWVDVNVLETKQAVTCNGLPLQLLDLLAPNPFLSS